MLQDVNEMLHHLIWSSHAGSNNKVLPWELSPNSQ